MFRFGKSKWHSQKIQTFPSKNFKGNPATFSDFLLSGFINSQLPSFRRAVNRENYRSVSILPQFIEDISAIPL